MPTKTPFRISSLEKVDSEAKRHANSTGGCFHRGRRLISRQKVSSRLELPRIVELIHQRLTVVAEMTRWSKKSKSPHLGSCSTFNIIFREAWYTTIIQY